MASMGAKKKEVFLEPGNTLGGSITMLKKSITRPVRGLDSSRTIKVYNKTCLGLRQ